MSFLIAAYAVAVVLIGGYAAHLYRRTTAVQRRLKQRMRT